jgi:glycosyltransferase involved in cell wall biosynthesis
LRRLIDRLDTAAMRGATAILAVCPALGDRAAAAAPGVPVFVVEDCSLIEKGTTPAAATAAHPIADPIVLYVGNLERYQGVELLVRAFAHAASSTPARLAIVGGRPGQVTALRALARTLGVADRVDLLGPRPLGELGALLEQATVLVSPRLGGLNTPMKIYSYLDSGRPLLATRVTAHTQILDDAAALLAEPLPGPFGDALVRLLADGALRQRLADGGRRLVRERLTPESQERKLVELYALLAARLAARHADPARPGGDSAVPPPPLPAEAARARRRLLS